MLNCVQIFASFCFGKSWRYLKIIYLILFPIYRQLNKLVYRLATVFRDTRKCSVSPIRCNIPVKEIILFVTTSVSLMLTLVEATIWSFFLWLNFHKCEEEVGCSFIPTHINRILITILSFIRSFINGSTAIFFGGGSLASFQSRNPVHSRWDSLDGGSAHRKAVAYT
jgi:hypothetical protein